MNPYQFHATCSVCGGEGMGTIEAAAAMWGHQRSYKYSEYVAHADPRVCRSVLAQRRRELERQAFEAQPYPVAP